MTKHSGKNLCALLQIMLDKNLSFSAIEKISQPFTTRKTIGDRENLAKQALKIIQESNTEQEILDRIGEISL